MTRILAEFGPTALAVGIQDEPRLSKAQKDAIFAAGKQDPFAVVRGLDEKMRPVVCATLSGPGKQVTYAILRNGEPRKPVLPMAEVWR